MTQTCCAQTSTGEDWAAAIGWLVLIIIVVVITVLLVFCCKKQARARARRGPALGPDAYAYGGNQTSSPVYPSPSSTPAYTSGTTNPPAQSGGAVNPGGGYGYNQYQAGQPQPTSNDQNTNV